MKIFFISHSSVIPTYREKLSLLAQKKDVELTLLLPTMWPEAGQKAKSVSQSAIKEGFSIISAPVIFTGRVKRHFYPFFSHYIEKARPDIIHMEEEPYSLAAWQTARAAQKTGSRLVFFTWENLLENFPFPHNLIRKYLLRKANHAIAGDMEAGQLLQKAGYPTRHISVIPQYGVNSKLFKKKNVSKLKKELSLGSFTVGYVGRLVPEKGIQHLLESFAMLRNPKANLLVVGNGPLRQKLENRAMQLNISNQVRWVPAMDQTKIPDYFNCMNVLVLPSLTTKMWKEQFGRVLIEAQACEIPVIGSDSGAIPEVIGKAGIIFKEGMVSDLTQKLKLLSRSSVLQKKLGRQGRKRVLELYTNQKIANGIYQIYRKVLSS